MFPIDYSTTTKEMAPKKKKSKPKKKATTKVSKSPKRGTGKAKGKAAHPSKAQRPEIGTERVERSIPIGMPVSKEKYEEMKKKAGKKDD